MNEQHVTSLPLSQKLKAAGCPQVSEFWWVKAKAPIGTWDWIIIEAYRDRTFFADGRGDYDSKVSAYLASELAVWLPGIYFPYKMDDGRYLWAREKEKDPKAYADTLVDGMGYPLLHLAEQKLIKFKI